MESMVPEEAAFGGSPIFVFSPVGVNTMRAPTFPEWCDQMTRMRHAHGALQFWIGDLANYGEMIFGERAYQELDAETWDPETIRNYAWVAAKVPPENRTPALSFDHHVAVATLPPSVQVDWLQRALDGESDTGAHWSAGRLRAELAASGAKAVALVFMLIVDCTSEDQRGEIEADLVRQGLQTHRKERTRKLTATMT